MKIIFLTLVFFLSITQSAFSQDFQTNTLESQIQQTTYSYAYIKIKGKAFSKKLKVDVDFGDTQKQEKEGERYSEVLSNKKSYAAVLNHMAENGYELVQTLELTSSFQGSGGTSGIVFIMKKRFL